VSPVPRRRQYYEGATTSRSRAPSPLWIRFQVPRVPPQLRARRSAPVERGGRSAGLGRLVSRLPCPACCTHGRVRDLTGSLAIHPMPLPCSRTPAEPARPRLWRSCRCCPREVDAEGFSGRYIEANAGLQHPLSTLQEQRCRCPSKTRFRLAGCAFAGRASNPLDRFERFQVTSPSSSPGLRLSQLLLM
jgi:hypothetical protein